MGVILTPNLTPNLGSFSLLKKSSFYSESGVKITPKMGLLLLLTWVVFTLFGIILTPQYLGSLLLLKKSSIRLPFGVKIAPPKITSL